MLIKINKKSVRNKLLARSNMHDYIRRDISQHETKNEWLRFFSTFVFFFFCEMIANSYIIVPPMVSFVQFKKKAIDGSTGRRDVG